MTKPTETMLEQQLAELEASRNEWRRMFEEMRDNSRRLQERCDALFNQAFAVIIPVNAHMNVDDAVKLLGDTLTKLGITKTIVLQLPKQTGEVESNDGAAQAAYIRAWEGKKAVTYADMSVPGLMVETTVWFTDAAPKPPSGDAPRTGWMSWSKTLAKKGW